MYPRCPMCSVVPKFVTTSHFPRSQLKEEFKGLDKSSGNAKSRPLMSRLTWAPFGFRDMALGIRVLGGV